MSVQECTWIYLQWKIWSNNTPHQTKKITQSLINLEFYAKNKKQGHLVPTRDKSFNATKNIIHH